MVETKIKRIYKVRTLLLLSIFVLFFLIRNLGLLFIFIISLVLYFKFIFKENILLISSNNEFIKINFIKLFKQYSIELEISNVKLTKFNSVNSRGTKDTEIVILYQSNLIKEFRLSRNESIDKSKFDLFELKLFTENPPRSA